MGTRCQFLFLIYAQYLTILGAKTTIKEISRHTFMLKHTHLIHPLSSKSLPETFIFLRTPARAQEQDDSSRVF